MELYEKCLADIAIAQSALKKSLLMRTVADRPLLCDLYCNPAVHYQTFYLQVYGGSEYTLLYAKTFIADHLGLKTVAPTFQETVNADNHPAFVGDIYCGIKHLPINNETISHLIRCLPTQKEICQHKDYSLDGSLTTIRNCLHQSPIPLTYYDSSDITKNIITDEQKDFIDHLDFHIEKILGNLMEHFKGRSPY